MATKTTPKYTPINPCNVRGSNLIYILQSPSGELQEINQVDADSLIQSGYQVLDYVSLGGHVGLPPKLSYDHFLIVTDLSGHNVIIAKEELGEYAAQGYCLGKSGSSGARGRV